MIKNKALVVGSVAYDIIFSVHNKFSEEVLIKDGKIGSVSMMLTAQNKFQYFGGTGGNIAYGLGLQGENPLLFSVVGDDFEKDYKSHLESVGVDLRLIVKQDEFTATFYGISDSVKDQIGIFQPNTHGDYMQHIKLADTLNQTDLESIKVAIFSPGTGESIENHMVELRSSAGTEPVIIFDPSQILSIFFDERRLKACLEMSDIFIGNETEIKQLKDMLKMNEEEIMGLGLKYIIETKGAEGSLVHYQNGDIHKVEAVKPKIFVEQTGAGDAFRAGLIKGLLQDLAIEDCCKIGSIMGSKNVEAHGGQKYSL